MLLFAVARPDRPIVISYAAITISIAFLLSFIKGRQTPPSEKTLKAPEVKVYERV
jgi:hypothetical protein